MAAIASAGIAAVFFCVVSSACPVFAGRLPILGIHEGCFEAPFPDLGIPAGCCIGAPDDIIAIMRAIMSCGAESDCWISRAFSSSAAEMPAVEQMKASVGCCTPLSRRPTCSRAGSR